MKIQITFYPDVDKKDLEDGLMAETSWQRLLPHLAQCFGIKPNERLLGITVTEAGIKGKIETFDNPRYSKPSHP